MRALASVTANPSEPMTDQAVLNDLDDSLIPVWTHCECNDVLAVSELADAPEEVRTLLKNNELRP